MTAEVLKPEQFNELFTIYAGQNGPVERTLREMTAGEVTQAMEWNAEETELLKREAAPFIPWAEALEAGGELPPDLAGATREQFHHAVDVIQASGEAEMKLGRLMHMIVVMMPRWRGQKMPMAEAVRRYWPGGR